MALAAEHLDQWIAEHGPWLYHATSPTWLGPDSDLAKVEKIVCEGIMPTASFPGAPRTHAYLGSAEYVAGCGWWNPPNGDFPGQIRVDLRLIDPTALDIDPDQVPEDKRLHTDAADGIFFAGSAGEEDNPQWWMSKEDLYLAQPSAAIDVLASLALGSCSHRGLVPAESLSVNPDFYSWLKIARTRVEAGASGRGMAYLQSS